MKRIVFLIVGFAVFGLAFAVVSFWPGNDQPSRQYDCTIVNLSSDADYLELGITDVTAIQMEIGQNEIVMTWTYGDFAPAELPYIIVNRDMAVVYGVRIGQRVVRSIMVGETFLLGQFDATYVVQSPIFTFVTNLDCQSL